MSLPPPAKHTILVPYHSDSYVFHMEGNTIKRVIKQVGDSGMEREVDFRYLPEPVKASFAERLNDDE